MNQPSYDRSAGDIGNLIALEHLNLQIPDQGLATAFYVSGLGLTRDPYLFTGTQFMWVNAGANQFHLISGQPQVVSGRIGLVLPDLDELLERLAGVSQELAGTQFSFVRRHDQVLVTCPWGNRFCCEAPGPRFGRMTLGLPYVEFDVAPGRAAAIAGFYRDIFGAKTVVEPAGELATAHILAGLAQELRFAETRDPIAPFDGHHIQVYVADFSGPHERLRQRGLVTEESNEYQYRFDTIADLGSGAPLSVIEHEVRSLRHPLYARPLVNRNPGQSAVNYAQGRDAWVPPDTSAMTADPRFKALLAEREALLAQRATS